MLCVLLRNELIGLFSKTKLLLLHTLNAFVVVVVVVLLLSITLLLLVVLDEWVTNANSALLSIFM